MQIKLIKIKNILGIEGLEFKPGKVNLVEGENGSGKTSFLAALKDVVGGGHDGTLLRNGHKKGEIVLVLDNGMTLTKEVGHEKSKVTLKDGRGATIPKAATYIKEIVDSVGVNPISLLTAAPRDQVDILLSSIVLSFPGEELSEILGQEILPAEGRSSIAVIDGHRKSLYDTRAGINRSIKEKEVMVDQLRETIPEGEVGVDLEEKLSALEREKTAKERALISEQEAVGKKQGDDMIELTNKTNERIMEINKRMQAEVDNVQENKETVSKSIRDDAEAACAKIRVTHKPAIEDLAGRIAVLKEKVFNSGKVQAALEFIGQGEKDIEARETESNSLSEKITSLDALKVELLKNIPIEGLEIKDGEMLLDGIPFETVNEAKRIQFCLTVAGMRESELPLVCVDGLEALDHESFDLFQKEAKKTNMQFFVTRVTDDEKMNVKEI